MALPCKLNLLYAIQLPLFNFVSCLLVLLCRVSKPGIKVSPTLTFLSSNAPSRLWGLPCGNPQYVPRIPAERMRRAELLHARASVSLRGMTSLQNPLGEYGTFLPCPRDFGYVRAPFPSTCARPLDCAAEKGSDFPWLSWQGGQRCGKRRNVDAPARDHCLQDVWRGCFVLC